MKQQVRELLLTTKVAQHWQGNFDEKVDELMLLVSKIDTEQQTTDATEVLDVYHNKAVKPKRRRKAVRQAEQRPFEFVVFSN